MSVATNREIRRQDRSNKAVALSRLASGIAVDGIVMARPDPLHPKKYEAVGWELYQNWLSVTEAELLFGNHAVEHGFRVCARLAMWGARAYVEHLKTAKKPGEVSELTAVLHRSYDHTIPPFIEVDDRTNGVLEHRFGLFGSYGHPTQDVGLPYHITGGASGEEIFEPLPDILAATQEEARQLAGNAEPWRRCAAGGLMLRATWKGTVNTCSINPHLFAADLAGTSGTV